MNEIGLKADGASVAQLGLSNVEMAFWNLHPSELVEETILRGEGVLTDVGALAIDTGEFTGRSPKDKFVVVDENNEGYGAVPGIIDSPLSRFATGFNKGY